ncbi:Exonuclease, partial [Ramicandelaber brevisporus]
QKTGKYIGIDCEMVGVGPGGCESVLARVSVVNYYGYTLMDTFVMPQEKVTDYRTFVSGVTPELLKGAPSFQHVQNQVAELMKDRVVVGHSLENDFKALLLDHPSIMIRDTAQYKPFRQYANGRTPGLKKLAKEILNIEIQGGEHSSVEDARVAMLLYRQHRKPWEQTME